MVTQDELNKHPLFGYCRRSEKVLLRAYIDSKGSLSAGIRAALGRRTSKNRVNELLNSELVTELLRFIDQRDTAFEEDLEALVKDAIKKSTKPYEIYRGVELLKKMKESQQDKPTREDLVRRGKELDKKWRDKNVQG